MNSTAFVSHTVIDVHIDVLTLTLTLHSKDRQTVRL